jgi:hypothetical protein
MTLNSLQYFRSHRFGGNEFGFTYTIIGKNRLPLRRGLRPQQLCPQPSYNSARTPSLLAQRLAPLSFGLGIHQIGDRFSPV